MGIVKISDLMHENLRIASQAMSRSINSQAEHWLKLGMLAELYPQLNQHELAQKLIRVELNGGSDIRNLIVHDNSISQGNE
ncbi:MAG: ParD-like family protein [Enterobacterales bacterium endosymbiont of Blomia tropicalis]|uniref:ParD-like family protein n=1 Tax=Mixta mediterraneensis TaxID=2758443 RepID=UPI0018772D87|nr:ParD-like family protein [Mixta mediterraneensis]MBE5254196.1 ParD-like family protein [Mixta mediterraneensis]MDL4914516.1 ParD-like family protein [Mixta mediterraneensis]